MTGRGCKASSWSRANARSMAGSRRKRASTLPGQRDRTDDPRSLGGGKLPALGHGYDLSRRRMQRAHRKYVGLVAGKTACIGSWIMIFRDDECSVRTENTSASSRLKPSPDSPGYCPLNFLSIASDIP